ncbi:MAG: radical SAM protein [Paludibacteraceae bacterium]|nr:radical SAM protein [Paludibacteraceae bacterium]
MRNTVYHINEIFYSLQGEGFHTGRPAVFVRFAGCNLRCPFCDTDFSHSEPMTAEQIARRVFDYSTHPHTLIVLTGGEPSLQVDNELVDALHAHQQTVTIETNGTHPVPDNIDWVTVSPKVVSADESKVVLTHDAKVVLTQADEVKVVFTESTEKLLPLWRTTIRASHYYLQPCAQPGTEPIQANTEAVVAYILSHPDWHLSLQTHKYLHIR